MSWLCPLTTDFPVTPQFFRCIPSDRNLLCQKCPRGSATIVPKMAKLYDPASPWIAEFQCSVCESKIYWCRICRPENNLRWDKPMQTVKQVNAHSSRKVHLGNLNKHSTNLNGTDTVPDAMIIAERDISENSLENHDSEYMDVAEDDNPDCAPVSVNWSGLFPNHRNSTFFEYQAKSPGEGFSKIGSRAIHRNCLGTFDHAALMFLFSFQKLNESLTGSQSVQLTDLLRMYKESLLNANIKNPPYPLPTSVPEMNSMFGKGKFSVKNNLPKINLQRCGSYVVAKPSDCLREAIAFCLTEEFFPGTDIFQSRSPRGKELINHAIATSKDLKGEDFRMYNLFLWEDDLDPSNVKQNRHKVFVQVLTVAPKDSEIHTSRNTFIICLGPSHQDRTEAQQLIAEDLQILAKGINCYHSVLKKEVPTIALVYSIQADSPAKATATRLLAGNSPYHTRFGYVGDISNVAWKLASCPSCWNARKEGRSPPMCCFECYDWCFEGLVYATPSHYPTSGHGSGITIGPELTFKIITFDSCRNAVEKINVNCGNGTWKAKHARCFGKTEGLTIELIDEIVNFARSNNPDRGNYPCPPAWNYPMTSIQSWIPAPMHLLFLGITKAVFGEFLLDWLASNKKKTYHARFVNDRLLLLNQMRLPWLKAEPLSKDGRFGRFVSENYLAFAKVCKWLYACLGDGAHEPDPEYKDPPGKAISDYTRDNLKGWLRARNQHNLSKLSKEELYQKVIEMIDGNGGAIPPVTPLPQQKSTVEDAECLVSSLLAMICRVMIHGEISSEQAVDCDRHIKHFLSTVAYFLSKGEAHPTNRRLPEFITKYNFMNLLSLPSAMLHYFSLRLVWEGDGKGEGSLPILKQKCIKSLKGERWQQHAFENYLDHRAIDRCIADLTADFAGMKLNTSLKCDDASFYTDLEDEVQNNNEDDEIEEEFDQEFPENAQYRGCTKHRIYKAGELLRRDWGTSAQPVTLFQLKDDRFYAVCKDTAQPTGSPKLVALIECYFDKTECIMTCGASYFKWELNDYISTSVSPCTFASEIKECCLLLPHHLLTEHRHYYYLITSEWKEMINRGTISLSHGVGVNYI